VDLMAFTDAKEDRPYLPVLYNATFKAVFGKMHRLDYSGLGWGDEEAEQLAAVIRSGAFSAVEWFYLENNAIGEAGMEALAEAVRQGYLQSCQTIVAEGNRASCEPLQAALEFARSEAAKGRSGPVAEEWKPPTKLTQQPKQGSPANPNNPPGYAGMAGTPAHGSPSYPGMGTPASPNTGAGSKKQLW
jgi:hypothetical protein